MEYEDLNEVPDRLHEPMVEYHARQCFIPSHVYEDIKTGIEQADQGRLISFEEVMSRYQ